MSQNYEYFGKYILLEKLATGGMAEVWLARAPGTGGIGKFVAIKKILPQFSDNPEFIQMFKDEAAIAMNLSHSNIVSIYEFGQEKQQLFLVMDYVEGRNLRQMLNKMKQGPHKFSTDQVVYAVKEVAAGLDHAHRSLNSATGKPLNITHRDMSPQNIMITFEGEVKIVDFGIAKAESQMEATRTGTLKGKFGYMSPEQAEGHPTDLRTDVFSLGICLWELLAHDRLFVANNEINTLKKIRECNVPSLTKIDPNIHQELERIVMKSLARDRNLRYQTAAAMHRDLSRFLNRQFPDFSPHDFSVFIKTLYTDEILDIRKRLIDYAKVSIRPTEKRDDNDKTSVTSFPQVDDARSRSSGAPIVASDNEVTATESFTDSSSSLLPARAGASPKGTSEDASSPTSTFSLTSSPENLVKSSNANPTVLDDKFLKDSLDHKILVNPKVPRLGDPDGEAIETEHLSDTVSRAPRRQTNTPQRKPSPQSNSSINLMIFVAFTIATYIVSSTYFPKEIAKVETVLSKIFGVGTSASHAPPVVIPKAQLPEMQVKAPAPPAAKIEPVASDFQTTTGLVVNSVPSGAEIYLNGLATGKTTPSRVEVPTETPFAITLKLNRFIDYTKSDLTTAQTGRSFSATLQKAMVAYVDIDVKPPRNARVYVNGRLIKDEILPINRYAVPAESQVTIRAENPLTGAKAERTIQLSTDQRYKVILKLDQDRTPSNR